MDENIQALKNPVYQPCGGCGATEPGQRCIGCLHDFGSPTHRLDPYADAEARRESRRVQELLEANNAYLERARTAEQEIAAAKRELAHHGYDIPGRPLYILVDMAIDKERERAAAAEAVVKQIAEKEIAERNKPTPSATFIYTNYRGETAERRIIPLEVWFGSTDWHPEPQWLLKAFDCEKKATRDFALKDFGQPSPSKQELTDKAILSFARDRNIYTRASASVPDLKTGGYRHPFTITISGDELRELFAKGAAE